MENTPTEYLTPLQTAKVLHVTKTTIYTWLREGKLPGAKIGRIWRIRKTDLDQFVNEFMNTKGD